MWQQAALMAPAKQDWNPLSNSITWLNTRLSYLLQDLKPNSLHTH